MMNDFNNKKLSIIKKIMNFIKKVLKIKSNQKLLTGGNTYQNYVNDNNKFKDSLKVNKYEYDENYELKKFTNKLEDNIDLVKYLSDDRLDKLIMYYKKITQENEEKIRKLKAS